MDKVK